MHNTLVKIGTACTSSLVVCQAVNLEPLWNALITLGISVLSCLAVEGVNWLKSYFNKKRKENEDKEDKEDDK